MISTTQRVDKLVAFLAGCVVAAALTNSLFSLTEDPSRGFDLHYADILLIPLIVSGFAFKKLRKPDIALTMLSAVIIVGAIWSEDRSLTSYTAIKFSLIILTFSSLRSTLRSQVKIFFVPIIISALVSLGVAGYQLIWLDVPRAYGISGNPNLLAGLGMVLMVSGNAIGPLIISTTGTRGILIALLAVLPITYFTLGRKLTIMTYLLVVLSIILTTYYFGTYTRITSVPIGIVERIPETIKDLAPIKRAFSTQIADERVQLSQNTIQNIKENFWFGTGFDTQTSLERNPHNIYLIFLSELGFILGTIAIAILILRSIGSPPLIAILIVGFFDHYWITTAQGLYLFSGLLALNKWRPKEYWNKTLEPALVEHGD
ncbi:hypothetical protein LCGC14_2196540 [marine sediment metagenome]|uniref:O-antigen ligase-related domain-containing protein n=1 Tax=marine sediment metagenome TaxID=412755 RepID=A0A0F9GDT7_9ZZZZ